ARITTGREWYAIPDLTAAAPAAAPWHSRGGGVISIFITNTYENYTVWEEVPAQTCDGLGQASPGSVCIRRSVSASPPIFHSSWHWDRNASRLTLTGTDCSAGTDIPAPWSRTASSAGAARSQQWRQRASTLPWNPPPSLRTDACFSNATAIW